MMKTSQVLVSLFSLTVLTPTLVSVLPSLLLLAEEAAVPTVVDTLVASSLALICWNSCPAWLHNVSAEIAVSVTVWLVIEVLFYFFYYRRRLNQWQELTTPPAYGMPALELHKKVLKTLRSQKLDAWEYFRLWFHDRKDHSIHFGNIRKFYAWAYFAADVDQLGAEDQQQLDELMELTEKELKVKFVPGEHRETVPIRLTLDPLRSHYRPLLLYVGTAILHEVTGIVLRLRGFTYHRGKLLNYWIRSEANPSHMPVLFFHGVGIGLFPYLYFLSYLCHGRTSILVELPFIDSSMMWAQDVPSRADTAAAVEAILKEHQLSKVIVVGHSFGSVVVGWVSKVIPQVVARTVFLDPVCFLLFLPHVAYNFQYRSPRSFMEHVYYYFASRELHIARTLKRHFWWYQNVVFVDELHDHDSIVFLGGRDEVAPTQAIFKYLMMGGVNGCPCTLDYQDLQEEDEGQPLVPRRISEDRAIYSAKDGHLKCSCERKGKKAPMTVLWYPTFKHTQMVLSEQAIVDVMSCINKPLDI